MCDGGNAEPELRLTPSGRKKLRKLMERWMTELEELDDPRGELSSVTMCYAPFGKGEEGAAQE